MIAVKDCNFTSNFCFCIQQSVKIDINIERDLAYALKVRECPQILFLRGNRILYREKGENLFSLKNQCFY